MKNILFFLAVFLLACGSEETQNNQNSEWLIPISEVFDGGPGKDGIPAVDDPKFDNLSDVDFVADDELVIGMVHDGIAKAYPHTILDWHEIVNDEISDISFGLTYCPLTGTGIAWDRNINGSKTTFGVSGKLYNTNLIPYDRASDSYWSQMRLVCVNGDLIGSKISTFSIIETSWATWKKAYPNTLVLNRDTGFDRNYGEYPYNDYRTNHSNIIFPVSNLDSRLPAKERVLGLVDGDTKKIYSINLFENGRVIEDMIDGNSVLVIGSKEVNFIVAFDNQNFSDLTYVTDQLPIIAEDLDGNRISLTGEVVSGPLAGTMLNSKKGFMGFFFAFGAFYDGIQIFEN